jgi:hypothetical protein
LFICEAPARPVEFAPCGRHFPTKVPLKEPLNHSVAAGDHFPAASLYFEATE